MTSYVTFAEVCGSGSGSGSDSSTITYIAKIEKKNISYDAAPVPSPTIKEMVWDLSGSGSATLIQMFVFYPDRIKIMQLGNTF
jgi:hypothetical protein